MRTTLVDLVEQKRNEIRLRAQGGPVDTKKPKIPGKQMANPDPEGQAPPTGTRPGAPGAFPQHPPVPGQPPMAPPPGSGMPPGMYQQGVAPYPPAPQARVMPGEPSPRTSTLQPHAGPANGTGSPPTGAPDPKKAGKPPKMGNPAPDAQPGAKPSPSEAATHVAQHVQDPLGETHNLFQNLGQKQMEYEMEKENARRSLAPVKAVLQHVTQMHQLDPPMMMSPDEAMGYQDPNNPVPPGQMMPGGMGVMPPPGGGGGGKVPPNMAQTPGQMNTNRPSQSGFGPGKTPGDGQTVRPGKMGQPKPGQGQSGKDAGNPGDDTAPGKAKGKKVSVSVEGGYDPYGRRKATSLDKAMAMSDLNCMMPMPGGGGGGRPSPVGPRMPSGGGFGSPGGGGGHEPIGHPIKRIAMKKAKKKRRWTGTRAKVSAHGKGCMEGCDDMHGEGFGSTGFYNK